MHEGRAGMKQWDVSDMMKIGRKLFAKIHKQKHHANPNWAVSSSSCHDQARKP
jgi:hypothetical protein